MIGSYLEVFPGLHFTCLLINSRANLSLWLSTHLFILSFSFFSFQMYLLMLTLAS